MKKFLALLLAIIMILAVCGCTSINGDEPEAPTQTPVTTGEPTQTPSPEPTLYPDLLEGGLSVNPEYLGLFGKNKGQVDDMFGAGEFWREWALMVYNNGVQVSYGTYNLDGDLDDSDMVYRMYLPLKFLFNDCPETITTDDIKATFANVTEGYSEEEGTKTLTAKYDGKTIMFYPEWGMDADTSAYIAN